MPPSTTPGERRNITRKLPALIKTITTNIIRVPIQVTAMKKVMSRNLMTMVGMKATNMITEPMDTEKSMITTKDTGIVTKVINMVSTIIIAMKCISTPGMRPMTIMNMFITIMQAKMKKTKLPVLCPVSCLTISQGR